MTLQKRFLHQSRGWHAVYRPVERWRPKSAEAAALYELVRAGLLSCGCEPRTFKPSAVTAPCPVCRHVKINGRWVRDEETQEWMAVTDGPPTPCVNCRAAVISALAPSGTHFAGNPDFVGPDSMTYEAQMKLVAAHSNRRTRS